MKKKYSVNWENDEVVSVEVDGVQYDNPDQIPDPDDRAEILRLMSRSNDEDFDQAFGKEFDKEFEEEFRQLERDSARFPKIIVGIFLAVAVIMLGIAAVSAVSTSRTLSREKSASGRVVDLVAHKDQAGQVFYFPVVEFYLPDESRQTVQLSEGSTSPEYTTGEAVIILYDPEQPNTARIKSFGSTLLMWIVPIITGVVGLAFLAATLFAGWLLKPKAKEAKPM
jgi:uncharacterized protein DUF3592